MTEVARGFQSLAGISREATLYAPQWPSSSAAPITYYLPFQNQSVRINEVRERSTTVAGGGFPDPSRIVQASQLGRFPLTLTYNYMEFFLASAFGWQASRDSAGNLQPVEVSPPSGAYRHRFELSPSLHSRELVAGDGSVARDRLLIAGPDVIPGPDVIAGSGLYAGQRVAHRFTMAFQMGDAVWETRSCVIPSIRFSFNTDTIVAEADILGYDLNLDSTVNTTLDQLPPQTFHRVLFQDTRLWIGPQSTTTPLDASNAFKITELDIAPNAQTHSEPTVDSAPYISEPTFDGPRTASVQFTTPIHTATSPLLAWQRNGTALMAIYHMTGPIIGNSVPYSMHFYFPHVVLVNPELDIEGAGRVQPVFEMEVSPSDLTLAGFPVGTPGFNHVVLDVVGNKAAHCFL